MEEGRRPDGSAGNQPDAGGDHGWSSPVWMVNVRTGTSGSKGRLRLEASALLFRPEAGNGEPTSIPFSEIRRVRRVLGSPVLEVQLRPGSGPRIMGFYFIRPPKMAPARGMLSFRNRYTRKAATERLREWNRVKKDEIAGWVGMIRSALEGSGSRG
jgi:hypothetical protein